MSSPNEHMTEDEVPSTVYFELNDVQEPTSNKRQSVKSTGSRFQCTRTLSTQNSFSLGCSSRGRSGDSVYSEFESDSEPWENSQPCSSSQADARKSVKEVNRNYLDTGYVSNAPTNSIQLSGALSSSLGEIDVAVKNLRIEDNSLIGDLEILFPLPKSPSMEIRKFIKDYDMWYDQCYYGHVLQEMTVNMNSCETPKQREGAVGKLFKKTMPLLFGKSHKSPADVVKNLREALIAVDKVPVEMIDPKEKKQEKALEEVSKNVAMIKSFIYGNDSSEPSSEHVVQVAQLAQEVYNANVLPMLVKLLPRFEFECKKDVGQIFNNLLRRQIGTRSPTVEYLGARPEILVQLVQGYSYKDIALTCGNMLRESIRHDHLAKIILYSDVFYTFFTYVQSEVFDIASDAFATFKDLTTRHKAISAEFLDANYDTFFGEYQKLLNSTNYVTRRQSLKLLGELLLDRHNFNIMTKYISNPDNLKLMMELLRDKSRNIQYEAFHVFKVFVANPNKPKPISDILNRNRDKLVEFLGEFHNDRTDDEQFNDEKAYLIKQIQEMKSSPKESKKKKEAEHEGTSRSPTEHQ